VVAVVTLRELADAINRHLKRLERDGLMPSWHNAGCYYMGGARLRITYVSRNGATTITRQKAASYLAWLDAGHAGPHTAWVKPNAVASTARLDGAQFR
jgi:hypothetical protein